MNFTTIHPIDYLLIKVYRMMKRHQIIIIIIKNFYQLLTFHLNKQQIIQQDIIHMYMVGKMELMFLFSAQIEEIIIQMNSMDHHHIPPIVTMAHPMVLDIHYHPLHPVVEMDDIQIIIIIKKLNVLY